MDDVLVKAIGSDLTYINIAFILLYTASFYTSVSNLFYTSTCLAQNGLSGQVPVEVIDTWLACQRHHAPVTRYVNCGLRMSRECRERFPRHQLQREPLICDPDMHHGTCVPCVTHVPRCMSESLTRGRGEKVPGIPGAWATINCAYRARDPCKVEIKATSLKILFI